MLKTTTKNHKPRKQKNPTKLDNNTNVLNLQISSWIP